MTKISTARRVKDIIWPNLVKVLEENSLAQIPIVNLQIPKCNHLGDGVRYCPSEVISFKISAYQVVLCKTSKIFFKT